MGGRCIWDDCDQEAVYCSGHARELVQPEIGGLSDEVEALRAQLLEHAEVCKEGPRPVSAALARAEAAEARVRELERLLNPHRWSIHEHNHWHKALPDVHAAFEFLRGRAAESAGGGTR